jgi:hypothetical protein
MLLADTIYALSSSPGATLGPPVRVTALHPRSRVDVSRGPDYQKSRREIVGILVAGQNPCASGRSDRSRHYLG